MNMKEIYEQKTELGNIFNNLEQIKARDLTNEYARMLRITSMEYENKIKYIITVLLANGDIKYLYAPNSLSDIIDLTKTSDNYIKELNTYLEEVETFIKFKIIDLKDGKKYIETLMK